MPIVSLPGRGYSLVDGYFLPPLLSTREATALVLGARLLAGQTSGEIASAADEAVAKLLAVIGDDARRSCGNWTRSSTWRRPLICGHGSMLATSECGRCGRRSWSAGLRRFVTSEETGARRLSVRLSRCGSGTQTAHGTNRVLQGSPRSAPFAWPRPDRAPRSGSRPISRSSGNGEPEPATIEVVVRFRGEISRWVRERQHWSFVAEEAVNDELLAVYRPGDLDEIAPWLLGWGTAAEVIAPQELRERLREEAQNLIEMLT